MSSLVNRFIYLWLLIRIFASLYAWNGEVDVHVGLYRNLTHEFVSCITYLVTGWVLVGFVARSQGLSWGSQYDVEIHAFSVILCLISPIHNLLLVRIVRFVGAHEAKQNFLVVIAAECFAVFCIDRLLFAALSCVSAGVKKVVKCMRNRDHQGVNAEMTR